MSPSVLSYTLSACIVIMTDSRLLALGPALAIVHQAWHAHCFVASCILLAMLAGHHTCCFNLCKAASLTL